MFVLLKVKHLKKLDTQEKFTFLMAKENRLPGFEVQTLIIKI